MATITKRGDYQYQAQIRRKGYPKQTKTFESKRDAEIWVRQIESSMDLGRFVCTKEADCTTLAEALERYLREVSIKKASHKAERNRINQWLKHPLALRALSQIRGKDIADFISEREVQMVKRNGKTAKVSSNTIRLELAVISHLFTVAMKMWGMESLENPVAKVSLPKPSQGRNRRLEADEEAKLLKACESTRKGIPWLLYAVRLALLTGMRAGEILSLNWNLVNLNKSCIHLYKTKNGNSRDVPLSSKAIALLKQIPRSLSGRVINAFGSTRES